MLGLTIGTAVVGKCGNAISEGREGEHTGRVTRITLLTCLLFVSG
jgi:hypothetical protein